jgi:hypothetical protein
MNPKIGLSLVGAGAALAAIFALGSDPLPAVCSDGGDCVLSVALPAEQCASWSTISIDHAGPFGEAETVGPALVALRAAGAIGGWTVEPLPVGCVVFVQVTAAQGARWKAGAFDGEVAAHVGTLIAAVVITDGGVASFGDQNSGGVVDLLE